MGVVAVTIAGRTSLAGVEAQLLVLAGGQRWCAAIHLESGALVTARWDQPAGGLAPLVLARAHVALDLEEPDPLRPEQLILANAPRPVGRTSRRRADRWLRPVLHPTGEHLLGFPGPSTPYWTLSGTRPSVAVLTPDPPPVLYGGHCRFRWRNVTHLLPLLPRALAARPRHPRHVVVTLSEPRQGHCYKVVAALF